MIVEHPRLTEASGDYVGEPVAPAAPAPPPAVIRHAAPQPAPSVEAGTDAGARFREALANLHNSGHPRYEPGVGAVDATDGRTPAFRPPVPTQREEPVEASTDAGIKFREALANLHRSGHPRYESPSDAGPATSPPPSPQLQPEQPGQLPSAPRLTHRRSLAESRKVGLGAPVQRNPAGEPQAGAAATDTPSTQALPAPSPPANQPPSLADALEAAKAAAEAAAAAAAATPAPQRPAIVDPPAPARPALPPGDGPGEPPSGGGPVRAPLQPRVAGRPIVDPASRPTASAAPLIFRSAPRPAAPRGPEGPSGTTPTQPTQQAVVTRPPAQLAAALRTSHGIDVADVAIRRDAQVETEAAQRRARAFTRGATVHLPPSAGTLTDTKTLGLLAHELVHAAQQRRLGSSLPPESSAEGQQLEAEALAAESTHGGSLTSADPLRHAPPPISASWIEDRLTQHALGEHPLPTQPSWKPEGDEVKEIKHWAAEIVKEATEGTGSLAGGLGGSSKLDELTVGNTGAKTEDEFREVLKAQMNLERGYRGLPPLDSLTGDLANFAHAQFLKAQEERNAALEREKVVKKLKEDREADEKKIIEDKKQEEEKKAERETRIKKNTDELKNVEWEMGKGFRRTDGASKTKEMGDLLKTLNVEGTETGEEAEEAAEEAADQVGKLEVKPKGTGKGVGLGAKTASTLSAVQQAELELKYGEFKIEGLAKGSEGIKNAGDYVRWWQDQYDQERAYRGLQPEPLKGDQVIQLTQQFNNAEAATRAKKMKDAVEKDRIAQEKAKDIERMEKENEAKASGTTVAAVATETETTPAATTPHVAAAAAPGEALASMAQPVVPHELDPQHLEELTNRLYHRLRSRLRTELLVDRERAGLLTDFR